MTNIYITVAAIALIIALIAVTASFFTDGFTASAIALIALIIGVVANAVDEKAAKTAKAANNDAIREKLPD